MHDAIFACRDAWERFYGRLHGSDCTACWFWHEYVSGTSFRSLPQVFEELPVKRWLCWRKYLLDILELAKRWIRPILLRSIDISNLWGCNKNAKEKA